MYKIQDLVVTVEDESLLKISQGIRVFSGRVEAGYEYEAYEAIVGELAKHPLFVPLDIAVVAVALNNAEQFYDIIFTEIISEATLEIIATRYNKYPNEMFNINESTAFINTDEGIFCVGMGSNNYIYRCARFKNGRALKWADVEGFSSRKQLESLVSPEDYEDSTCDQI